MFMGIDQSPRQCLAKLVDMFMLPGSEPAEIADRGTVPIVPIREAAALLVVTDAGLKYHIAISMISPFMHVRSHFDPLAKYERVSYSSNYSWSGPFSLFSLFF